MGIVYRFSHDCHFGRISATFPSLAEDDHRSLSPFFFLHFSCVLIAAFLLVFLVEVPRS